MKHCVVSWQAGPEPWRELDCPVSPVHVLDSIDTPQVMRLMRELVSSANVYYTDRGTIANTRLLHNIAHYLTFLLRVFGVVPSDGGLGFPIEQDGTTDQVSLSWRGKGG